MSFEMRDQRRTVSGAFVWLTKRVDLKPDILDTQQFPEPGHHDDHFGINVWTCQSERLDVDLVKLAIAPPLWTLMAKHRSHGVDTLWTVV